MDFRLKKKYDFAFTGNLHKSHTDIRYKVKNLIFNKKYQDILSNRGILELLKKNLIRDKFKKYNIYWAEWGSKNLIGKSLLPIGEKYAKFMNMTKVFFNTPSAMGLINTRFFELMATKSLIFCPESDYYTSILEDGKNCIMFKKDFSDFEEKFIEAIENNDKRNSIIDYAYKNVGKHSYDKRIETLFSFLKM